jgi:hypothetical protein
MWISRDLILHAVYRQPAEACYGVWLVKGEVLSGFK